MVAVSLAFASSLRVVSGLLRQRCMTRGTVALAVALGVVTAPFAEASQRSSRVPRRIKKPAKKTLNTRHRSVSAKKRERRFSQSELDAHVQRAVAAAVAAERKNKTAPPRRRRGFFKNDAGYSPQVFESGDFPIVTAPLLITMLPQGPVGVLGLAASVGGYFAGWYNTESLQVIALFMFLASVGNLVDAMSPDD